MTVTIDDIRQLMIAEIAKEMETTPDSIDLNENFQNLGLDSISSMYMINELEDQYDIQLRALDLMEYPTINSFSEFVLSLVHENK